MIYFTWRNRKFHALRRREFSKANHSILWRIMGHLMVIHNIHKNGVCLKDGFCNKDNNILCNYFACDLFMSEKSGISHIDIESNSFL
eukprot:UN05248